jgi:hypothetical protein
MICLIFVTVSYPWHVGALMLKNAQESSPSWRELHVIKIISTRSIATRPDPCAYTDTKNVHGSKATTPGKANEIYEGVFHRFNGFLLDLTIVYDQGEGRLQVPLVFSIRSLPIPYSISA